MFARIIFGSKYAKLVPRHALGPSENGFEASFWSLSKMGLCKG
jgi:hypothetical protein